MILTLIVIAVSLTSVAALAMTVTNAEAAEAARTVFRREGIAGVPAGCLLAISAVPLLPLWTWYAIDVGDWRFAAVTWVPAICNLVGRMATRRQRLERRP